MPEPPPNSDKLSASFADSEPDPKDEIIAQLERRLGEVTDKLYEERFVWILIAVILFNALIFRAIGNWGGCVVIGLLELIGIAILADRCKVNAVMPLIDKVAGLIGNNKSG